MGKRAREKKLVKVAQMTTEKTLIESRKKEQIKPTIRTAKKVTAALAITVFLLWVGVVVANRINMWGKS